MKDYAFIALDADITNEVASHTWTPVSIVNLAPFVIISPVDPFKAFFPSVSWI